MAGRSLHIVLISPRASPCVANGAMMQGAISGAPTRWRCAWRQLLVVWGTSGVLTCDITGSSGRMLASCRPSPSVNRKEA